MGCCCSKPEKDDGDEDARRPLLSDNKGRAAASQNPKYESMQEPVIAEIHNDLGHHQPPTNDSRANGVPAKSVETERSPREETTPHGNLIEIDEAPVSVEDHDQAPACFGGAHRDLLAQFEGLEDQNKELGDSVRNLQLMYPETNLDHSIKGCLTHIRDSCGGAIRPEQDERGFIKLLYMEELMNHSFIPAIVEFNKASELVSDIRRKGTSLLQSIQDAQTNGQADHSTSKTSFDELAVLKGKMTTLQQATAILYGQIEDASKVLTLSDETISEDGASQSILVNPETSEASEGMSPKHEMQDFTMPHASPSEEQRDTESCQSPESKDVSSETQTFGGSSQSPEVVQSETKDFTGDSDTRNSENGTEVSESTSFENERQSSEMPDPIPDKVSTTTDTNESEAGSQHTADAPDRHDAEHKESKPESSDTQDSKSESPETKSDEADSHETQGIEIEAPGSQDPVDPAESRETHTDSDDNDNTMEVQTGEDKPSSPEAFTSALSEKQHAENVDPPEQHRGDDRSSEDTEHSRTIVEEDTSVTETREDESLLETTTDKETPDIPAVNIEDEGNSSMKTDTSQSPHDTDTPHQLEHDGPRPQTHLLAVSNADKARLESIQSSTSEYVEALDNLDVSPRKSAPDDTITACTSASQESTFTTDDEDQEKDDSMISAVENQE